MMMMGYWARGLVIQKGSVEGSALDEEACSSIKDTAWVGQAWLVLNPAATPLGLRRAGAAGGRTAGAVGTSRRIGRHSGLYVRGC